MGNLTTEQPKSAEQILAEFMQRSGIKELRESLREMFFAALRSEWSNYIDDRTMYLTDFENIDAFLKDLEVYEDMITEERLLKQESEKAERIIRLDEKIQAEEIKKGTGKKKERQELLAQFESLKDQMELLSNEKDGD